MGDVADAMLDGTLCSTCGVYIHGEPPGYPRQCHSCQREGDYPTKCKHCNKILRSAQAERDHMKAKHP